MGLGSSGRLEDRAFYKIKTSGGKQHGTDLIEKWFCHYDE